MSSPCLYSGRGGARWSLKSQGFYSYLAVLHLVHGPGGASDQPMSAYVSTSPMFVSDLISTYTKAIHVHHFSALYSYTRGRPGIPEQVSRRALGRRYMGKPSKLGFLVLIAQHHWPPYLPKLTFYSELNSCASYPAPSQRPRVPFEEAFQAAG